MRYAISKNAKMLTIFAVLTTGTVGIVYELTKNRIKAQEELQLLKTLNAIIPESSYDNDIYHQCINVNSLQYLGTKDAHHAYLATKNGEPVAAAITTTAPDGYNGNIELLVALKIDGSILGVRTLKHQETPGLGDKIEERKSGWIRSFSGSKLESEKDPHFAVVKDGGMFDQFTGATITPRAVVKSVKNTAIFFQRNKETLFTKTPDCRNEQ